MLRSVSLIVVVLIVGGCEAPAPSGGETVRILALAGPTCPVVSDPPDPDCEGRRVDGAVIVVLDGGGGEVARMTTNADGVAAVELPPGRYRLVPQPVDGLMGTPGPLEVTVVDGTSGEPVTIGYDTGIR
ncbi:MAG TPA: carboxypeptidase-like regulatory domain-containing protein [Candidatus Limnocylindria bacterium]